MTLAKDTEVLETERLVLRRVVQRDLDVFARIHADPQVAQYIGHGKPRTPVESQVWLDSTLSTYEELGLGQLAVVRRSDGMLLGRCGLSDLALEVGSSDEAVPRCWWSRKLVPSGVSVMFQWELGYTFERSHWGHGYASEAAACVFGYVREKLGTLPIVSLIHPENQRSLKVANRFGLRIVGKVESFGRVLDKYSWPDAAGVPRSPRAVASGERV